MKWLGLSAYFAAVVASTVAIPDTYYVTVIAGNGSSAVGVLANSTLGNNAFSTGGNNAVIKGERLNRIEDVYLRFYNGHTVNDHIDVPLHQAATLLDANGFEKSNPTVIYVHGYIETPEQESVRVVVRAYLQARPGTNVILLDWSNMAHGSYLFNAAKNIQKVGVAMADQIDLLNKAGLALDRLHIIGFSLGCHLAGYIGRELKNVYNKSLKRVTALEPTFPGFYVTGVMFTHITANDAELVDVIHTDAWGYGAPEGTGTVDFWVNGGKGVQPGCPLFAIIPLSDENLCSHRRSWRLYAESVLNPEAFPAKPATYPRSKVVFMGVNCDTNASGFYVLTTNAQAPFGKGFQGLYGRVL